MLIALISVFSSAFAVAADAADCMPASGSFTSPAPLATDVPLDTVPAGLVGPGGCGTGEWTATLLDAVTGDTLVSVTGNPNEDELIEADIGADLAPNTTYTLRFAPDDGSGETVEVGFTTGEGYAVGLEGTPSLANATASWDEVAGMLTVSAETSGAPSADGDTIVVLAAEGQDTAWRGDSAESEWMYGGIPAATLPTEACLVARQRDIAGRWTESEPVCVAPDVITEAAPVGCLGFGSSSTSPAFLLGFVALARKRR